MKRFIPHFIALLALLWMPPSASAQHALIESDFEIATFSDQFSSDIDAWRGAQFKGRRSYGKKAGALWANMQHRFDEVAFAYGAQASHQGATWTSNVQIGTSSNGFFNEHFAFTASAMRPIGIERRLLMQAGSGRRWGRDGHVDSHATMDLIYWMKSGWVPQLGARLVISNPGQARGWSLSSTLNRVDAGERMVTLRLETSRQAYTVVSPITIYTEFRSHAVSLVWKEWLSADNGISFGLNASTNRHFNRAGFSLGYFWNR